MIQNLLGLIGYPLAHSFSKKYFAQKFQRENIRGWSYELFPLEDISFFPNLIREYPELRGLNVTIPYKEQVIHYLDDLDEAAATVGAVNTIRFDNGRLKGFNTDVYGFEKSLLNFLEEAKKMTRHVPLPNALKALVLGTGGAAKAVKFVLDQLQIDHLTVSRSKTRADLSYDELRGETLQAYPLIINTTPLGMSPQLTTCPAIPYAALSEKNILYDLIYNPEKTLFLKRGKEKGASTLNGYQMLVYQAEKAWEIWTK